MTTEETPLQLDTQTHLTTLRDMLIFRRSELRAEVHAAQQARLAQAESPTELKDHKEEAESFREEMTDDAQQARDEAELHQVEAALARLDAGRYGDCADCGDPIPLARLLAQPAANRCAKCQADREHRSH
jgi:DnaK suppressor protein